MTSEVQDAPTLKLYRGDPRAHGAPSNYTPLSRRLFRFSSRGGQGRLDLIDTFRGVAVLSVMAFHFTVALTRDLAPADGYGFDSRFPGWLEVGRYGVQVFFVISGLVIALTLSPSSSALEFAGRRFARIYPAFLFAATLALFTTAALGRPFGPVGFGDYLVNLTLLAPHLGRRWIDASYWTLLVEAKFYVVAGLSYALLGRRFWVGVVGYGLAAAAVAHFRPWGAHQWLFSDAVPYFLSGIAGWLFCFDRRPRAAGLCLVAALALEAYYNLAFHRTCAYQGVCLHLAPDAIAWTYIVLAIGTLLTLLACGVRAGFAPLTSVGRISYSLYLLHALVGIWVIRSLKAAHAPDLAAVAAAVAVTIPLAALMFTFVEEPGTRLAMRLQKRLQPRPKLVRAERLMTP